jgi:hypothetical protein
MEKYVVYVTLRGSCFTNSSIVLLIQLRKFPARLNAVGRAWGGGGGAGGYGKSNQEKGSSEKSCKGLHAGLLDSQVLLVYVGGSSDFCTERILNVVCSVK